MRLIAGCPIADRAWAVPHWFDCLAAQSRRPDGFVFVVSGGSKTPLAIAAEAERHGFSWLVAFDSRQPHERHDNTRFRTLADIRNRLLWLAWNRGADLFLSLDSDIMLEEPGTIERLEALVNDGADIAAPLTHFHPLADEPEYAAQPCWAYNAGWWRADGTPGDPERPWVRPEVDQIPWGDTMPIDIPMGVWLGNRRALDCRYEWHLGGEDLGFAQDIERRGLSCVWDTSLRARHVWSEQHLDRMAA